MARAISVKVATTKVIKALEDKLDAGKKAIVSNEKKRKDYEKVEKAWAKEVSELAFKHISKAEVSAHENYRNEVNVNISLPAGTIKFPEKPSMELENELARYEVQEIENAIRILKMTDEEFVNASTFKQVAQYL
jgi:vacuolar-type H+-ATPase subunit I/STV1